MYPRISITRETELEFKEWMFLLFDFDVVLDSYRVMTRETKKHKFKPTQDCYARISDRNSYLKENEVPFPDELKLEVKQKVFDKLKVCLWSERNS